MSEWFVLVAIGLSLLSEEISDVNVVLNFAVMKYEENIYIWYALIVEKNILKNFLKLIVVFTLFVPRNAEIFL
jgi:hypothetical protein